MTRKPTTQSELPWREVDARRLLEERLDEMDERRRAAREREERRRQLLRRLTFGFLPR
jgi:hypothetical protein